MSEPVLKVDGLIKRFGGLVATDNLSLDIRAGEIHAVIGPNGAGKTTMIGQLIGELRPDAGSIRFMGQDITALPVHARADLGIARSFQITSIFPDFTAHDNAALAVQARQGHSFRFWGNARADASLRDPALRALEQVGLAHRADTVANALSHGEHRQLEIAMALATAPKLLLLDEPMAGMGPEDSARMVQMLKRIKGSIPMLLIEHDMDAVFALADRITVLVYGRNIATDTPDAIRSNEAVRQAYLGDEMPA
jgi:branched-chain amino acid transport system ATP-binding protein